MTEELKPCPRCGKPGVVYQARTQPAVWFSRCDDDDGCGLELLREWELEVLAVRHWNRRASPWVSVEERLPEEGRLVLVQNEKLYCGAEKMWLSSYEAEYGWMEPWDDEPLNCEVQGVPITHWMPVPELQTKKEGAK